MNKHGQSLIEYALIAILVMLGIVIMGPYALRSINAHFKLWNDGVQDSFTENLKQSTVIPNITSSCTCNSIKGACGATGGGTGTCGPGYREYDDNCNPQGCDEHPIYCTDGSDINECNANNGLCKNGNSCYASCVADSTCCTTLYPQGCGTYPCPASGCAGAPTTPPVANNCYYGQQIMASECASLPIQCNPSATCPTPTCLGILSPGALYCATNSITPPTGLTQNYVVTYVPTCPNANPCAVFCNTADSYLLNPTGTSCLRTFQVALTTCQAGCNCTVTGTTTVNDCSFSMCAGASAVITNATVTDISSPQIPPGCSQPQGNPGEECQVTLTF